MVKIKWDDTKEFELNCKNILNEQQTKFMRFLVDNSCIESFLLKTNNNLDTILMREPKKWISSAFVWGMTSDLAFWEKLNKKWINVLNGQPISESFIL